MVAYPQWVWQRSSPGSTYCLLTAANLPLCLDICHLNYRVKDLRSTPVWQHDRKAFPTHSDIVPIANQEYDVYDSNKCTATIFKPSHGTTWKSKSTRAVTGFRLKWFWHRCLLVILNFFKKKFWRTQVLFVGPLIPLFWTSGDICPGFLCDSQIHLWCNACWLCRGQYSSWAFSVHVLTDHVSTSIGWRSNPWLCTSQHITTNHLATPAPWNFKLLRQYNFEVHIFVNMILHTCSITEQRPGEKWINWSLWGYFESNKGRVFIFW